MKLFNRRTFVGNSIFFFSFIYFFKSFKLFFIPKKNSSDYFDLKKEFIYAKKVYHIDTVKSIFEPFNIDNSVNINIINNISKRRNLSEISLKKKVSYLWRNNY